MPQTKNWSKTQLLALWFWEEILGREDDPWKAPAFRRYLAEAKRTLKGLDISEDILRDALREMKAQGVDVQSISLPLIWEHHYNGPCWYEWVKQQWETPPPIYELHAYKAWCEKTGNQHLLAQVPEIYHDAA